MAPQRRQKFETVHTRAERRDYGRELAEQARRPHDGRVWMTTHQVAAYLGLGTVGAVYYHCRQNGLPHARLGRTYRFDRARVDAWLGSLGGILPLSKVG